MRIRSLLGSRWSPATHTHAHTHTHTRTHTPYKRLKVWIEASCQPHCVTVGPMTSPQPLQSYASASTHTHTSSGGALIPLWLIFAPVWRKSMTGSLHLPPPQQTHTHMLKHWLDRCVFTSHHTVSLSCSSTFLRPRLSFIAVPPSPSLTSAVRLKLQFCVCYCFSCTLCSRGCLVCRPLRSHLSICVSLYRPITAFSSFCIFICVLFFTLPGLPPLSPSISLFTSSFSPFISLPPSPTLPSTPPPHSLFLSHRLSILNTSSLITFLPEKRWIQLRGSSPLPSPVAMTTASALSFIEVGWKEGGGGGGGRGGGEVAVCRHPDSTKESHRGETLIFSTSLIWCHTELVIPNLISTVFRESLMKSQFSVRSEYWLIVALWHLVLPS